MGQDPMGRLGRLVEGMEITERLWTGEPVSYSGRHFNLREEIARSRDTLGVTAIIVRVQWPGMAQAQVLRTIRLLGEQVFPHLR